MVKEKKKDKDSKFKLSERITSKDIIKTKQVTIKIPERKVENVFEDENRFFKGNFDKEKRSMFLS